VRVLSSFPKQEELGSMSKKGARGELASARVELPLTPHARTKGRNGSFSPRLLQAVIHRHADGTPLITIRHYSRRQPANAGAPSECTLPLFTYRYFARQIESALDDALTSEAGGWIG
jgi:hypothetical protein